jgi:peptidoglycan/xylan/chitin deacetylase (PgdA/CDA1 family)
VLFAKSRSISYDELLKIRTTDKRGSAHRFFFTFDDGFAECYTVIRPILLRHAVDAAFFVVTDYLDDREPFVECRLSLLLEQIERVGEERLHAVLGAVRELAVAGARERTAAKRMATARFSSGGTALRVEAASAVLGLEADDRSALDECDRILGIADTPESRQIFLSREQVRQLSNDGFTIRLHARQHRLLEYRGIGEIVDEIVASCEEIRRITGQSCVPFAFPYRGVNVDREKIAGIMRRHPWIELIFDSVYMRRHSRFIVN